MACALAGDTINDANFTSENGNAGIMQLSTLEMFFSKAVENKKDYRAGVSQNESTAFFDEIFQNQMEDQITKVRDAYEKMIYRDVVKYGFHDFSTIKDMYLINCDNKPRIDLI